MTAPVLTALGGLPSLGPSWLEPEHVITSFGPWAVLGVALLVFAETGLLLGVVLPGDTLLFTTGLLTATGSVSSPLWLVCAALAVAAVLGGQVGYAIGRTAGRRLLERTHLVSSEQLARTDALVADHGRGAVVAARFLAVVRTVMPLVAGAARMPPRTYAVANAVGGAAWAVGLTLAGAELGRVHVVRVFVLQQLDVVLAVVVALSLALGLGRLLAQRRAGHRRAGRAAADGTDGAGTAGSEGTPERPAPEAHDAQERVTTCGGGRR